MTNKEITIDGIRYWASPYVQKVELSNTFAIGELIKHHACPEGAQCVNPDRFVTRCDTCWRYYLNQRVRELTDGTNL